MKHGALAAEHGQVLISWRIAGEHQEIVQFEWCEKGGPAVCKPTRQGFGHLVLTHLVAQALGGGSAHEYLAEGYCWKLTFPKSHALKIEGQATHGTLPD